MGSSVLDTIAKQCPELIEFCLQSTWILQPQQCGKLLDTTYEQRCLQQCIKDSKNLYFSIDLTTIAAGR